MKSSFVRRGPAAKRGVSNNGNAIRDANCAYADRQSAPWLMLQCSAATTGMSQPSPRRKRCCLWFRAEFSSAEDWSLPPQTRVRGQAPTDRRWCRQALATWTACWAAACRWAVCCWCWRTRHRRSASFRFGLQRPISCTVQNCRLCGNSLTVCLHAHIHLVFKTCCHSFLWYCIVIASCKWET